MDKNRQKIIDDVIAALDGRTQRWLALEIKMPENNLSKRMQGVVSFSQDEIDAINARLNSNIILQEVEA